MPSGSRGRRRSRAPAPGSDFDASGEPFTENVPSANSRSSSAGLEQVGGERLRLLEHLAGGLLDGDAADDQRARAVGVHAHGDDLRVAVRAARRPRTGRRASRRRSGSTRSWWPWPCGVAPETTSTLPVGSMRTVAASQPPAPYDERAEDAGRRQAAHLGERRDADAELHRVVRSGAGLLLGAQAVVVEQLLGLLGRGLVVARVVGEPRDHLVGELLVLDPVLLAQLHRVAGRARRRARP